MNVIVHRSCSLSPTNGSKLQAVFQVRGDSFYLVIGKNTVYEMEFEFPNVKSIEIKEIE